jgi:hypothetical protein
MLIETTLHVHKSILDRLDRGATMSRRSRTSIIKLLIQRIMQDNQRMIKTYSRIKYQERDVRENWSRVNIVFNEYEYEYCQDLRKFFKMSVSLILAYAVLRYLDEVLKQNKRTDKYFYKSYILIKNTSNGAICWHIYWGIPLKLNTLILR